MNTKLIIYELRARLGKTFCRMQFTTPDAALTEAYTLRAGCTRNGLPFAGYIAPMKANKAGKFEDTNKNVIQL